MYKSIKELHKAINLHSPPKRTTSQSQIKKPIIKMKDGHKDRETERQRGREAERQRDRET
jgi:hypothetical protein